RRVSPDMPTRQILRRIFSLFLCVLCASAVNLPAFAEDKVIRIGIIGCGTSHVPAFAKEFNDDLVGFKVTVAFPGGSADLPDASMKRVPGYVAALEKMGVEIVDSIPKLLDKCD